MGALGLSLGPALGGSIAGLFSNGDAKVQSHASTTNKDIGMKLPKAWKLLINSSSPPFGKREKSPSLISK